MCTVLFAVQPDAEPQFLLLGTRDEFVDRPWDPPSAWWPDKHPELVGGRDREAGGTWLAVHPARNRTSVVLNRWDGTHVPTSDWYSRGALPLLAADTADIPDASIRRMRPFNLLTASTTGASWLAWDGRTFTTAPVEPGVHILAARGLDDPADPRIRAWLPHARNSARPEPRDHDAAEAAWRPWLKLLRDSADGYATDTEEALIRRRAIAGRSHATLALCAVALGSDGCRFDFATLPEPGHLPAVLPWLRSR